MTLNDIKKGHDDLGCSVYHYAAQNKTAPYVVWAEDGEGDSGRGDNRRTTRILAGTTDLFTKRENDPLFDKVERLLEGTGLAFRLNSVQYEDDTGLLHYEWAWEAVC